MLNKKVFNSFAFSVLVSSRMERYSYSIRSLSRKTGISPATISRIANGKTPEVSNFLILCDALVLNPSTFLLVKKTNEK